MSVKRFCGAAVVGLSLFAAAGTARAEFFGNTQGGADFPAGAASFADAVADFSPAVSSGSPSAAHLQSGRALGTPDYNGVNNFDANPAAATFISLGNGGSVTLRFIDNVLTGSGNADADLFIFEVGPAVEDTLVEISTNGQLWHNVGKVFGSFSTIDIDAFGFGVADEFAYIRLTDDVNENFSSGATSGADIDAVGAISTRIIDDGDGDGDNPAIPEPASAAILLAAAALILPRNRRRPIDRSSTWWTAPPARVAHRSADVSPLSLPPAATPHVLE